MSLPGFIHSIAPTDESLVARIRKTPIQFRHAFVGTSGMGSGNPIVAGQMSTPISPIAEPIIEVTRRAQTLGNPYNTILRAEKCVRLMFF